MEIGNVYRGTVSCLVERVHNEEAAEKFSKLNFNEQGIGDTGISTLCTVLNRFSSLQFLWLEGNHITSIGVSALCDILPQCAHVSSLNLSNNSIDDMGAKRIAGTLKHTKLEFLGLSNNDVGRDGICALFLCVANCSTLKVLDIEGNAGLEASVSEIVDILPHCNALETLWLGGVRPSLSAGSRQLIRRVMEKCPATMGVHLGVGGFIVGLKECGSETEVLDRSALQEVEKRIWNRDEGESGTK